MLRLISLISVFLGLIYISATFISKQPEEPKVLVFSKTSGYHHASIPDGIAAIKKLGSENGFAVDTSADDEMFTEENLKNYSAVIFLSTTGDVLNAHQEAVFERFIQAGGGYVGIHAAADTEYEWGWYGRLVGGYFSDHPGINDPHPNVQEGILDIVDNSHASTHFLPERWTRTDEWYSYKEMNDDVNVLMTLDENSFLGGENMGNHPIAWYHDYDGGRAFYTGGGHTSDSYTSELFLKHTLAGIQYAIGKNSLDYSKAKTHEVPEENRFAKTTLVGGGELVEPTEMAILPNLDVLIAQRRGEIMLYKSADGSFEQAGYLDVYWETDVPDVNAEEGVIGIQIDPDFEDNKFVYIFHTPTDSSVNRLSRFKFEDDLLDMDSEKVVLEFYSQRDICCHTGGSLAFGDDRLLYISTGDNSTPFNQPDQEHTLDGYAPLDTRRGFEQYDASRTAGNSNDLRGGILRIQINEDGSYDIPEGNLYPVGMDDTRPEIYVQGTRNPYRISVDSRTGNLYWGEVGPDAREDSVGVRGSLGYDEINQAREAGYFGWPFFVGDNYTYNEYDYATGTTGAVFDAENPANNSPNNTGIEELPPAEPAFIWYPYSESEDFPQVGTGGRNAMAGPVYYTDLYPEETRLPGYYDGKLFIYDWIRNWVKVVTLQPNGDFDKMEPFMGSTTFNAISDMEVGPDGRFYILEYGNGWFAKNSDSGLSRIDFNSGNRAPVIHSLQADKKSGLLPLNVAFTVDAEDPEQDHMTYKWEINGNEVIETKEPGLEYTFDEIGEYEVSVEVSDEENLSAKSDPIAVYSGNSAPVVNVNIEGNRSFYFPGNLVTYNVNIENETPEGVSSTINASNLFVSADYIETTGGNEETAESEVGHQVITDILSGKRLIEAQACQACHSETQSSIGPSYMSISERYKDSTDTESYLAGKIINGSSGAWGSAMMPVHAGIPETDARKIASWIQSLADEEVTTESLSAEGKLEPTLGKEAMDNGMLVISASYTDEGGTGIKPLTGHTSLSLKSNIVNAAAARNLDGYSKMEFDGNILLIAPTSRGSFSINQIDLTGIQTIELTAVSQTPVDYGYNFELRLDKPDGMLIGEGTLKAGGEEIQGGLFSQALEMQIESVADVDYHDVYMVSRPANEGESSTLVITAVEFKL